ncbi:Endochitinase [Wickerhamiella sorbophila]|uniref:chitinase n=1 Tax=Wickerhamiella sorbophila TaxID=45607 RepID=A0A2T0FL18_9ASCO|nr:Endochitinase [Wickerhamiella sorbophila]PRT55675.1 Endochitinase [Wickerhamiella sorbophila]
MIAFTFCLSYLIMTVHAAELALYWGQASAGSQKSLADYCSSTPGDIYIVSFLSAFSGSGTPTLNVASACTDTFSGSSLLHCPQIGQDIKTCQSQGKKVLLSLGGASGAYGFSSDADGEAFAQTLWDTFGGGSTAERPFDDAVVDGFDFDIENNNQVGYVALANKLRQLFSSAPSKQFYISAAPQCPYPDASVGDLLSQAQVDYAFIQFYNNYCSTTGSQFNWDTWQNFATNTSPNKSIKLFLGLPGSSTAAGSGYATPDQVKQTLSQISGSTNYGGISVWDASQADSNIINGKSFATLLGEMLNGGGDTSPAPSAAVSSTPAGEASSAAAAAQSSGGAGTTLQVTVQGDAVVNADTTVVPPAASSGPTTTVQYTVTVMATQNNVQTRVTSVANAVATNAAATAANAANYQYTPGQVKGSWSNTTAANSNNNVDAAVGAVTTPKWSNDTQYTTVFRSHVVTMTVTVSVNPSATGLNGELKAAANLDKQNQNGATVTTTPAGNSATAGDGPTTYITTTVDNTITVTLPPSSTAVSQQIVQTVSPTDGGSPRLITSYRVFVTTILPTAIPTSSAAATPAVSAAQNGTEPVKREVYNKYDFHHRHHARSPIGIVV